VSSSILLIHGLSSNLLSNHVSHNSHHCSTSIIKLSIELASLLLGVKDVISKVTYSIVSIVLGSRQPSKLNETKEGDDLSKSSSGNGEDSVNSSGDIRELEVVGGRDVSVEDDVVVVNDGSYDSCHSNTSVLALDSTAALEGLWFGLEPSERIENSERLGSSEFDFTDLKGGSGLFMFLLHQ
jgi:hypothetical protein